MPCCGDFAIQDVTRPPLTHLLRSWAMPESYGINISLKPAPYRLCCSISRSLTTRAYASTSKRKELVLPKEKLYDQKPHGKRGRSKAKRDHRRHTRAKIKH